MTDLRSRLPDGNGFRESGGPHLCPRPRRRPERSGRQLATAVEDSHEPQLKVKDENVGWKHTCSGCSHAGFERIGSRSGYNPVEDIYILQRPSSCDPHFRYSEMFKTARTRFISTSCRDQTPERRGARLPRRTVQIFELFE